MDFFIQPGLFRIKCQVARSIHKVVAEHLDLLIFHRKVYCFNPGIFNGLCCLAGNRFAFPNKQFAR